MIHRSPNSSIFIDSGQSYRSTGIPSRFLLTTFLRLFRSEFRKYSTFCLRKFSIAFSYFTGPWTALVSVPKVATDIISSVAFVIGGQASEIQSRSLRTETMNLEIQDVDVLRRPDWKRRSLPVARLHRTVFAPVRTVRPVRRFLKNELFTLFAVRTVRTI